MKDSVKRIVKNKLISVEVNKNITRGLTIQVTGTLTLNTKGLSKLDITALQPFITGYEVTTR
jgi:hypothetical protein